MGEPIPETTTETTTEKKVDVLSFSLEAGKNGTSESTGPNPDDQWLAYRDEALKIYGDLSGVWGRTAQEGQTRRNAILGGVADRENFDPARWRKSIEESITAGVGAGNIARFWEVYDCGGSYQAYIDKKYGDKEVKGKVTVNDDGSYYV
jgi:hypothetical protein